MGNEASESGRNSWLVLESIISLEPDSQMTEIHQVIRLAWDYPTGGQATYGLQPVFVNLSREQVRQGYEVHVIASLSRGLPVEEIDYGVMIHRVPSPFGPSAFRMISRLGADRSDSVVHAHATSGLFPAILRRFGKRRLVAHAHGVSMRSPRSVDSRIGHRIRWIREVTAWKPADMVLSVCDSLSRDLVRYYGIDQERIRTVYNGVDESAFSAGSGPPLPGILPGKKTVLYVGHFGKRKGVQYLIRAMKQVREEVPEAHLLCIGGSPKWLGGTNYRQALEEEIGRAGVKDCVSLRDAIPNVELAGYYSAADVFALPSYYEAFPKVVLEAMACSKPIVSTNIGGVPEMVEDGKNGLLVNFGAVEELAAALVRLLHDDAESRRMGQKSRERVVEMFTWKKVVERIAKAYEVIHQT